MRKNGYVDVDEADAIWTLHLIGLTFFILVGVFYYDQLHCSILTVVYALVS